MAYQIKKFSTKFSANTGRAYWEIWQNGKLFCNKLFATRQDARDYLNFSTF